MKHIWTLLLCILIGASIIYVIALNKTSNLDPLQQRTTALLKEIRCMVCNGESIHDSRSDHANDVRQIVTKQIAIGKTNTDIKNFLIERYGDDIILTPPIKPITFLLWFGPAFILLIGIAIVWRTVKYVYVPEKEKTS